MNHYLSLEPNEILSDFISIFLEINKLKANFRISKEIDPLDQEAYFLHRAMNSLITKLEIYKQESNFSSGLLENIDEIKDELEKNKVRTNLLQDKVDLLKSQNISFKSQNISLKNQIENLEKV